MSVTIKSKTQQDSQRELVSKKRKGLEILVWAGAVVGTYFIIHAGIVLYDKYHRLTHPKSLIYGEWVEYDVATYQAEHILINDNGVIVNGGVVDTNFDFDGEYLVYQHGTQERRFRFQYENWNQMTLQTSHAYKPMFVKSTQ